MFITTIIGEFDKLKCTGSYDEYVDKFEELRACMSLFDHVKYSYEHYMASFVSGLGEKLQAAINTLGPTTLQQTIEVGKNQLLTIEAIAKKLKGSVKPYSNPNSVSPRPNS